MAFVPSNDQRVYVQATSPWAAAVPNSSGTATLAAGDAVRHVRATLQASMSTVPPKARSGSLGRLLPRRGRGTASFELEVPLQGSGAAGTAPDMAPILQAIFGAAGTVTPSTSVAYSISETLVGLAIWLFQDPNGSNIWSQVLFGGLVNSFEINLGGEEEASILVSGPGVYVVNKPKIASLETWAKGGLTSFPSEPGSVSYLGQPALAFVGSITLNGVGTFQLERARIFGEFNRTLRPGFGSYASTVSSQGVRTIAVDLSLYEEDTADFATLRHLAHTKGSADATIVIGDEAGNIHTFALNQLVLGDEQIDDSGDTRIVRLPASTASMTSLGANDELVYTLT